MRVHFRRKVKHAGKRSGGRHRKVLEIFVQGGAPEHILYEQKPHLGTDQLIGIVTSLREQIEQMGGSFCFTKKVTDLDIRDGKICRIQLNDSEWVETQVWYRRDRSQCQRYFPDAEKTMESRWKQNHLP